MVRPDAGGIMNDFQLPPQNELAELSVLGSCLRNNNAIDEVATVINSDDFYFACHGMIFSEILNLRAGGRAVDPLLLYERIKTIGKLDEITTGDEDKPGRAKIQQIYNSASTGSHAAEYARIVADKATARRLIALCTEIIRDAHDGEPVENLVSRFETQIFQVAKPQAVEEALHIGKLVQQVITAIDERHTNKTPTRYIRTPLDRMNNVIGGLHQGRSIIMAARPGIGKSAMALNFALHAAQYENTPAYVFSLEMKPVEWAERAIAHNAQVPLNEITGTTALQQNNIAKILNAQATLDCPVWIDNRPSHNIDTLTATIRRAVRKHNVGVVFVDYLGLIEHKGTKQDNLATKIGNTSKQLKRIARELNIPIVTLAQLNREIRGRTDGEPVLTDLRDSGDIEQDADDVIFLYTKPGAQNVEHDQNLWVKVAKQRNGPTPAPFSVIYKRPFIRFFDGIGGGYDT